MKLNVSKILDTPLVRELRAQPRNQPLPLSGVVRMKDSRVSLLVSGARNVTETRALLSGPGASASTVALTPSGDLRRFTGDVTLPSDGRWVLDLQYRKAGQSDWTSFKNLTIEKDTTGPTLTLAINGRAVSNNARIAYASSAAIVVNTQDASGIGRVVATLQSGGRSRNASVSSSVNGQYTVQVGALPEGTHTLSISATDRAGNSSSVPLRVDLEVKRQVKKRDPKEAQRLSGVALVPITSGGRTLYYLSKTEVSVSQFKRFYDAWNANPRQVVDAASGISNRKKDDLAERNGIVDAVWRQNSGFPGDMPVRWITREIAIVYCSWAGGRIPTRQEWVQAAATLMVPNARLPAYKTRSGWSTDSRWLSSQKGSWSNYNTGKPIPVSRLNAESPFGLSGMAGNVEEWVRDGSYGTIGGSYKYRIDNKKTGAALDRKLKTRNATSASSLRFVETNGIRLLVEATR